MLDRIYSSQAPKVRFGCNKLDLERAIIWSHLNVIWKNLSAEKSNSCWCLALNQVKVINFFRLLCTCMGYITYVRNMQIWEASEQCCLCAIGWRWTHHLFCQFVASSTNRHSYRAMHKNFKVRSIFILIVRILIKRSGRLVLKMISMRFLYSSQRKAC